jgi:hypothetical protein
MTGACCKRMEAAVNEKQIEVTKQQEFDIPGCCGGGCNVISDIKFCPFCGKELAKL